MKNIIAYLLILSLFSCKSGVNNSVSNDGINPKLSEELNSIETNFIRNLKSGNYDEAKTVMSKLLTNTSEEQLAQFLNQLSSTLTNSETSILDQYHIQNSTGELPTTLFSSLDSVGGYLFRVKPINKEAFLSLRKIQSEPTQLLLTNLYTKYDEGWKLDMVKLGEYSILNKNAQLLHLEAENEYENGNLLNASNLIFLSSQVSNPAGKLYTYKNVEEMESSFKTIIEELKSTYSFPILFENVSTKPKIFNFTPEIVAEGIIPTIAYQTSIPVSDTLRLKKENNAMHNKIETVLKNIKNNNKHIIYKAMNEIPDGTKGVDTYTFVKENTEDNK